MNGRDNNDHHDFSARRSGGSIELNEGTGPIIALCSFGKFLEVYKRDKTFTIQTPNCVDPEMTNPNAPWVATPVSDIGSANAIVSRVILQSSQMLNASFVEGEFDKEAILAQLHACKELLIACDKLAFKISRNIDAISAQISELGIARDPRGQALNPFPHANDLDQECAAFLIQANRTIKSICGLPSLFFSFDRVDSNFDHLTNRIGKYFGSTSNIHSFMCEISPTARYISELRNYHEHPGEKRTVIDNYRLMPDGKIREPHWYLYSGEITNIELKPIRYEVHKIVDFLLEVTEVLFINILLLRLSKKFPYIIEKIDPRNIREDMPIRYVLAIDDSQYQ